MCCHTTSFTLSTADETAHFAAELGQSVSAGDAILLSGTVGAGKTHFARHLIRAILSEPEDIPSPTFTLVQVYDTAAGPLWHSDLYRIASVQEIEELGLTEAFDSAICLVEWPDRLGDLAPASALSLDFSEGQTDDARTVSARWSDPKWTERIEKWTAS